MSKYTFRYDTDFPGGANVIVEFDDTQHPFIEDMLSAFHQFLLGVTYQPGSINKFLDTGAIERAQLEKAELARKLT